MSWLPFIFLTFTFVPLVSGWGGLFSRYNPGLFAQFGFGEDGSGLNTVRDDSVEVSWSNCSYCGKINAILSLIVYPLQKNTQILLILVIYLKAFWNPDKEFGILSYFATLVFLFIFQTGNFFIPRLPLDLKSLLMKIIRKCLTIFIVEKHVQEKPAQQMNIAVKGIPVWTQMKVRSIDQD